MKTLIEMRLSSQELEMLKQGGPEHGPELAKLIIEEVSAFGKWMEDNMGGPLTNFERAAVQTYIYSKLVGRLDNLPRTE